MEGRRKEPTDAKQRALIASACFNDLKLTMPFLLDDMENSTLQAYRCFPARACVISADGKLVWASRGSPRGASADPLLEALREVAPGVRPPAIQPTRRRRDPRKRRRQPR